MWTLAFYYALYDVADYAPVVHDKRLILMQYTYLSPLMLELFGWWETLKSLELAILMIS